MGNQVAAQLGQTFVNLSENDQINCICRGKQIAIPPAVPLLDERLLVAPLEPSLVFHQRGREPDTKPQKAIRSFPPIATWLSHKNVTEKYRRIFFKMIKNRFT